MKRLLLPFLSLVTLAACSKPQEGTGISIHESEISKAQEDTSYYSYGVARLSVMTDGGQEVTSKESGGYVPCTVSLYGDDFYADRKGMTARIRGRGNSTWYWYPKKPYRIKLDESSRMMGMKRNRDWVLLADFRDVTHLMNNVAFTLAHELGLPCANHSRYVNLRLNGRDMGLYMLTEQVEEGQHRVPLDSLQGILLALDLNDGPGENPGATDNFWSGVFGTACAVKYPDVPDAAAVERVRSAYAALEGVINRRDWDGIQRLLDVDSMIRYILIQEIIGNGELDNGQSMRSGYIHRHDPSSKWVMGPMWDADSGFGYDASDMFNRNGRCHTFYADYRYLVFGTDPYHHVGAMGASASDLFCKLFGIPEFVVRLQACWEAERERLLETVLSQIDRTEEAIGASAARDTGIWGIGFDHATEVAGLKTWLSQRFAYLDGVVKGYPVY